TVTHASAASDLYGGVRVVAPFGPGAGVGPDAGITENFCRQVGETGAVVGLAVGDHLLVRRDTQRLQTAGQIPAQAQPALRVHARGPLEVDRPGNMSALGGKHPHTLVLGGGAGVPDDPVRVVQISHQGIHVYGGAGIYLQGRLGGLDLIELALQGQTLVVPGHQAAVDIAVSVMPDAVEQPDETAGPAATLVVVDNVMQLVVMAQAAEDMLQAL